MPEIYDAVVIGAGHNGLVAAHYLSTAGLSVCIVESAARAGGLCRPVEFLPGYRGTMPNSPGSFEPMILRDMGLLNHGLVMKPADPTVMMPFTGDSAFIGWRQPESLAAEYAKFSSVDGSRVAEFLTYLDDFARRLDLSIFEPPPSFATVASRMKTPRDELDFCKLILGSGRDLMEEWFESEEIRAVMGMLSQINGFGPSTPGSAMSFLNRPLSVASSPPAGINDFDDPRRQPLRGSTGIPIGGMGSLVDAMVRSLSKSGAQIVTGNGVDQIRTDKRNHVTGVVLKNGKTISAKTVISATNPKITLLDLLDPNCLDVTLIEQLQGFKPSGATFKVFLALDDFPRFTAAPKGSEEAVASCQFRIAPSLDYMDDAWADNVCGRLSKKPIVWGLTPTVADPSQAPPGRHYVSMNAWYAPYHLKDGDWKIGREVFAQRCVDALVEFAPNVANAMVDIVCFSPLDLEEEYGLIEGHQNHGRMGPAEMFGNRPLPGLSDYRTPVTGLYLSGGGTWPGGLVTGVPGHNAAKAVLQDVQNPKVLKI